MLKKFKGMSNLAIVRALKCLGNQCCILKKEVCTGQVVDLPHSGHPRPLSKKWLAQFDSLIQYIVITNFQISRPSSRPRAIINMNK